MYILKKQYLRVQWMIQQDPKILITDSFGIKKKINKKVKKKDLNSIMNAQVLFSP